MPNENENSADAVEAVPGPNGTTLTRQDLPPTHEKRWGAKRKAQVVTAVESGLLSLGEARRRYALSVEEFVTWQRALHSYGTRGLQAISLVVSQRRERRARRANARPGATPLRNGGGHA
jgi:hypothetical protein